MRETTEFANRAALPPPEDDTGRVDVGGVECTGSSSSSSMILLSTCDSRARESASSEAVDELNADMSPESSSKAGIEGKDGIEAPSAKSIRRHTRDGVSRRAIEGCEANVTMAVCVEFDAGGVTVTLKGVNQLLFISDFTSLSISRKIWQA